MNSFTMYYWFMPIGFYFTIGILMTLSTGVIFYKVCSWLIGLIPKRVPKIVAPPYIKYLNVKASSKIVTVSCVFKDQSYVHSVLVASHGSVSEAAMAAQTELVAKIAEEHDGSEHY